MQFGKLETYETLTPETLKVRVTGVRCSDDDWRLMLGHLCFETIDVHSRRNLLVDLREVDHIKSITTDYYEAGDLVALGYFKLHKIAVLDSPENRGQNDFMEDTSDNRGLNIRFFYTDEDDALAWLEQA